MSLTPLILTEAVTTSRDIAGVDGRRTEVDLTDAGLAQVRGVDSLSARAVR